ncbi:hypothetical protein AB837_00502 [bacterium AB1]|nr:hypothetical protein AB837_00502 [bacterium AB1]
MYNFENIMCNKFEEIKKTECRVKKTRDLLYSVLKSQTQNTKQIFFDFSQCFTIIEQEINKMYNINGKLEFKHKEILLDDKHVTSLLYSNKFYYFCEYSLNSSQFKELYINKKNDYDLYTLGDINRELDSLTHILTQSNLQMDKLRSYSFVFVENVQTYFQRNKTKIKDMVQTTCQSQIDNTIRRLMFFSDTRVIMKQLYKFRIMINSLHESIIKNSFCVKYEHEVVGPTHYIQMLRSDNLQYHITIYENYLHFVKQVYSILDYLNKPTGEIILVPHDVSSGVDSELLLDSVVFDIDKSYNKEEVLKILKDSDFEKMGLYKQMKHYSNKQCLLRLKMIISEAVCEYEEKFTLQDLTKEEIINFFPNLSKKVEKMFQEFKQPIYHDLLKEEVLMKTKEYYI